MALKATIHKADLQIADMDRHYYQTHGLTIAQHPSETDLRMMLRVLVFARHAHEFLEFTKGLSTQEEPDLWQRDLTGAIDVWIELGQPEEKRIRQACGRARQVFVYTYSGHGAEIWWRQNAERLAAIDNLSVIDVDEASARALAGLASRNMQLQCTIQDGEVWLGDAQGSVEVKHTVRQAAA